MFFSAAKFSAFVAAISGIAFIVVPTTAIPILSTVSARATYTGDGTYFDAGLGACGIVNTDADMIAAVGHVTFDTYPGATANPNLNPICGKKSNRELRSVCPPADLSVGRIHGVTWDYAA
ncbi:hypothetical protein D9757_006755 [Collybiopsis confluens]|uniref:Uncharacterized protein n=1 Tax=Collybiopsis confluens TaxID=2823264 RepID=A0A8H5HLS4_9AGAR|nr:hypothetical protein D9757_006755 [Collybiopsis confluens]